MLEQKVEVEETGQRKGFTIDTERRPCKARGLCELAYASRAKRKCQQRYQSPNVRKITRVIVQLSCWTRQWIIGKGGQPWWAPA